MITNEKDKKNLKVLRSFRFKGEHVEEGSVIPKTMFPSANEWLDLCCGSSPKLEQTTDGLKEEPRTPNATKAAAKKKAATKKATMPKAD